MNTAKRLLVAVFLTLASYNFKASAAMQSYQSCYQPSRTLYLNPAITNSPHLIESCLKAFLIIRDGMLPGGPHFINANECLLTLISENFQRSTRILPIVLKNETVEGQIIQKCDEKILSFFGEFELKIKEYLPLSNKWSCKDEPFVYTSIGHNHLMRDAIILINLLQSGFRDITVNLVDTHEYLLFSWACERLFNANGHTQLGALDLNLTPEGEITQLVRFMEIIRSSRFSNAKIKFILHPTTGSYLESISNGTASKADCLIDYKNTQGEALTPEKQIIKCDTIDLFSFIYEYNSMLNTNGIFGVIHNYLSTKTKLDDFAVSHETRTFIEDRHIKRFFKKTPTEI